MVQKWFTEFRCDRTSTETIPSPGCLNETTTPEMINKIHDIVLNYPKVKVRKIAEIVSVSTERVVNTLHTHLCMRKLWARWVPWLLTIDQKRIRVATSEQNLAYFNRNPKKFCRPFLSVDETWIHQYTPEWHEGSKQWVKSGESAPKRPKTQQSAGEEMTCVFWDAHGEILHKDFRIHLNSAEFSEKLITSNIRKSQCDSWIEKVLYWKCCANWNKRILHELHENRI